MTAPIDLESLPLTSKAIAMALQHIRICAPHPTVDAALEDAIAELTTRRARDGEAVVAAARFAHDEFEDKRHVAQCRGDKALAGYYERCRDRVAPALAEHDAQPAPAPVQVDDAIGKFGHHPDPATDFEVEVTSLQGRLFNAKHAIPDKHGVTESVAQVADAIKRAMTFRVGGVETSVRAKSILRALELDATQPTAPGEAELPLGADPVAWTFQHEDTGRMTTLENDGINNPENFVANNPRLVLCEPLYSAKQVREAVRAAIAALRQPVPDAVRGLPIELADVAHELADGSGSWVPCPGCYETSDGYNVAGFPHSDVFRCNLGGGCRECGGIGAVWEEAVPAPRASALASQQESRNAD
jgi:hypothetical protein